MKKETESKIDEILCKYAANQKKEREAEGANDIKKRQFKEDFEEARKNVIIPTLEEIKEKIVSHGIICNIIESEGAVDLTCKEKEKRITFRATIPGKIFGDPTGSRTSDLTFIGQPEYGQTVVIHEKISSPRGGSSESGIASYNPKDIDASTIEKHVTDFLEKILSKD